MRGYLNLSEKTKETIVSFPHRKEKRIFNNRRCWCLKVNKKAELIYVGRSDQVKIREQRVELEVIETVIMKEKQYVRQAIVMKTEISGTTYLVAYILKYVNVNKDEVEEKVRRACKQKFSSVMIPSWFVVMDLF